MRTLSLSVIILSLLADPSFGQAANKPAFGFPPPPNHLVPIDPYPDEVHKLYLEECRKRLQVPDGPEAAVMVNRPSFSPEECLVVHKSNGKKPTYTLIHTRANRNIWDAMGGTEKLVKVARREATLPQELAERVCRVWDRMLRSVRYPAEDDLLGGTDGETIEFHRGRMYGETDSPDENTPKLLVDLGRSLIDYCAARNEERAEFLKVVEKNCKALEVQLDKEAALRNAATESRCD